MFIQAVRISQLTHNAKYKPCELHPGNKSYKHNIQRDEAPTTGRLHKPPDNSRSRSRSWSLSRSQSQSALLKAINEFVKTKSLCFAANDYKTERRTHFYLFSLRQAYPHTFGDRHHHLLAGWVCFCCDDEEKLFAFK